MNNRSGIVSASCEPGLIAQRASLVIVDTVAIAPGVLSRGRDISMRWSHPRS